MAVTLKDIAVETGINIGSISNVLNSHPKAMKLKEETREKIRRAAKAMGYCRNEMAHAIVTSRARIVAFIAADMGQISYTGKIQEGVFEEASERGYAVSFYHLTAGNQQEIVRKIREWKISGVVFHVCEPHLITEISREVKLLGLPFGMVNLNSEDQAGIGVTTDDFQGAVDIVKHLGELGHRRITHITVSGTSEFTANRRNGYLEGMRRLVGGSRPRIIEVDKDDCSDACKKLLSEPETSRPSAIFCVMDTWAMELMRVAIKLGVKIPTDLSIAGFGNLDMAEFATVPLTTVAQPFKEMGRLTTSKIIEAIENPNITKKTANLKLKTELIVRESTAQWSRNNIE